MLFFFLFPLELLGDGLPQLFRPVDEHEGRDDDDEAVVEHGIEEDAAVERVTPGHGDVAVAEVEEDGRRSGRHKEDKAGIIKDMNVLLTMA